MASITANGSRGHHKFTLELTETYVSNASGNYSTVAFTFKLAPIQNGWDWNYSSTVPVTYNIIINGTEYSGNIMSYNGTSTVTVKSGSLNITHNNDGAKTINYSFSVSSLNVSYLPGSASASGSMTLTKIPRYFSKTPQVTLTAKTETTATFAWSTSETCDKITKTLNGTTTNLFSGSATSGTFTITGLTAGASYTLTLSCRRKDSQLSSNSNTLAFALYAYPYANSTPDFMIGDVITIGIFNPFGHTVTVSIIGADNTEYGSITTSDTATNGYADANWRDFFYSTIPNSASGQYKVKVVYGNINTTVTNGGTYTVNANQCKPTIGTVSYKDVNRTIVDEITGNDQKIVQQKSIVEYKATGLSGNAYASVASCSVTVNGNTYNLSLSESGAVGGNASINSGTDVEAVFTVTDSRGITATKSINITMLAWSIPTVTATAQRQDNYYSETNLTADANYAYLDGGNYISIGYAATKEGDASASVTGTLQDKVTSVVVLDNRYAWDIVFTVADAFEAGSPVSVHVSKGMPIIFFDRLKSSVGVNCFPVNNNSFEVNGIDLMQALFLSAGDTYTVSGLETNGVTTNSNKTLRFSVILPKMKMPNTQLTVQVNTLKLNVRTADGGYTLSPAVVSGGYDVLNDSTITVSASFVTDNAITFQLVKTSAYNGTNNTPEAVTIEQLEITLQ